MYAAASLGLGHKGLSQFCGFLNMPPPVHHDSYQIHLKQISEASITHAEENMKSAVSHLKSTLKDGGDVTDDDDNDDEACTDVGVSCDGSWHRRGFSSLVGTTATNADTGKKFPILIQRNRHGQRTMQVFVPSITQDLLLEWKLVELVECGIVRKKKTNFGIPPFLVMVIANLSLQFHRKRLILWLKLIV